MVDFKTNIAQALEKETGVDCEQLCSWLEVPPEREMGDYALPCFKLSKTMRKAPPVIAQALHDALNSQHDALYLERIETVGGYLNFFLDKAMVAREVVSEVLQAGPRYGGSDKGKGKTICIDYSSINIAKRFHIGHLSTTVLGNALYKIYQHLGYKCVGINHLGDWGTQFGKLIVAFKRWGTREQVEQGGVDALSELYVRFHQEAENEPALEDEGRYWFKKIEDGDEEALSLFNWFKELTLKDAQRVYDLLGVHFDSYAGESFYNDKMGRVIDELEAKGLLTESQGAKVVDLSDYNLPPCLILKSDGATLYATRDIAAALYRKDTYDFDKCLYVVAYQQNLHFAQWFKVVEMMGYPWAKDLEHVAFGMISFEGQTLSTRKGHVVYLDELLERAVEKTRAIIEEKSPDLEDKDEAARQVGIGAVIFNAMQAGRIKDIDFWWDRALNFDGETGPYVQYTHARCCSVLRKAQGYALDGQTQWEQLTDEEAQKTIMLLMRFPEVVEEAALRNEPSMITRHTVEIAKAYNKFYYEHRILDEDEKAAVARLQLTRAVRQVIAIGLGLLGIEAPERM